MKLLILLIVGYSIALSQQIYAQDCAGMDIRNIGEIPSTSAEMTMTMREDNAGRSFLYVANKEGGLKIYNIVDHAQPNLVQTIPTSKFEGLDVMNLTQEGNYLYLALGNHFTNPEISGMAIVDITSPALADVTDYWTVAGDTSGAGVVKVEGNYAYLGAMKNGLIILDISDKTDIKFVSQFIPDRNYPTPNPNPALYNARGMEVRNDIVYLCFDAGGLRIVNVSDKAHPRETGRFSNPLLNGKPRAYNNLVLDDTLLYVAADYCGVEVLSIADTANIRLVGWWDPFNCVGANWFASPVHANEIEYNKACRKLFVSTGRSDMYVLDVSDPSNPDSCRIYGGLDNGLGTWGVSTYQDYIYLSYIIALIPFQSDWTGVKILQYDPCNAAVHKSKPQRPRIYPQPAGDRITVSIDRSVSMVYLTVTDMLGNSRTAACEASEGTASVDISTLSPGAYTLHVIADSKTYTQRFVKIGSEYPR